MESRYILFSFTATPVELRADWRDFSAMVQLDSRAETWLALVFPYIFSRSAARSISDKSFHTFAHSVTFLTYYSVGE